jgi:hypothetical protein
MKNCSLDIKQTDVLRDANRGVPVLSLNVCGCKSSFILINDGTMSSQYFSLAAFQWYPYTSETPMTICRLLCMPHKTDLLKQGISIGVTCRTHLHAMLKLRIHGALGLSPRLHTFSLRARGQPYLYLSFKSWMDAWGSACICLEWVSEGRHLQSGRADTQDTIKIGACGGILLELWWTFGFCNV